MHELSIAQSLIDAACEAADGCRVDKVYVRIGRLSSIVPDALTFCFELAGEGTLCQGAQLAIEVVPAIVFCSTCQAERTLADVFEFACPICGASTPELLSGRELELHSLELSEHAAANC